MSGPVWRRIEDREEQCESCLERCEPYFAEGVIESGEFKELHHYCERCYEHVRLRSE